MAANLTEIAISSRKVIRYGVLFIIIALIARMLINFGIDTYRRLAPKPSPKPTARFGPLPSLPFPKPIQELPKLNITLETATGGLPKFGDQGTVYFMPGYASSLFSFDTGRNKARALGFDSEPLQLSQSVYRFLSSKSPSQLEINIVTGSFSISYNLSSDPTIASQAPPTTEVAAQQAVNLLSGAGTFPDDFKEGNKEYEYLRVEGQNLVRAISLSEANFVKVGLFRKKYNELPPVTSDPKKPTVWFIMAGGSAGQGRNVIAAQYKYYPIDEKRSETYPLRPIGEAFNDLKEGKAHIANLGLNQDGNVTIRDVSLGYYDAETAMQFYQPVYVFRGDREFVAYVPAISKALYNENK